MNRLPSRTRPCRVASVLLLGTGTLLLSCDGPEDELPACPVQDSPYWQVKYDVLEAPSDPACAAYALPPGEQVRLFASIDQKTGERRLTFHRTDIVNPYGAINGPSAPLRQDTDTVCTAESFTLEGRAQGAPNTLPSDVRVYVPPERLGNQFSGVLTHSENGCTWRYAMHGLFPAVACDPTLDASDPANAARTCGEGSGLDPRFAVTCDARLRACVPAKAFPSLK